MVEKRKVGRPRKIENIIPVTVKKVGRPRKIDAFKIQASGIVSNAPVDKSLVAMKEISNQIGQIVQEREAKIVDPWAHRSKNMSCATCIWAVAKQPSLKIGRCRRHAPTMNGYPVIYMNDWCGDHKLDEAKAL